MQLITNIKLSARGLRPVDECGHGFSQWPVPPAVVVSLPSSTRDDRVRQPVRSEERGAGLKYGHRDPLERVLLRYTITR